MAFSNKTVTIHWTSGIIGVVVLFLAVVVLNLCVILAHNKIAKRFVDGDWAGLQKKIRPLKRISFMLSAPPNAHPMKLVHDGLCVMYASISYCEGNEAEFIRWLQDVKNDVPVIGKAYILALYDRSRGFLDNARIHYQEWWTIYESYLERIKNHPENQNADTQESRNAERQLMILQYFFSGAELPEGETEESICAASKNPAIKDLLQRNFHC